MNSMIEQVHSLPELIRQNLMSLDEQVRASLEPSLCRSLERLTLTGCGDSHHAALCSELAFESLAGLPTEALTALHFARYSAYCQPSNSAVMGISVSGEVARTVEALNVARQKRLPTIAITAASDSRLAHSADFTISTFVGPFPETPGSVTPGVRTFTASLLCLYLSAIQLGQVRGMIDTTQASALRRELLELAGAAESLIETAGSTVQSLVQTWKNASQFVYLGGGPNYGSALFCAAKMLEASGDPSLGQDTEEWAHLQYFGREPATPTILISAGEGDRTRMTEVAVAAQSIGRRLAMVTPGGNTFNLQPDGLFSLPDGVREIFSPLLAVIPGMLLAAYRAELLGEAFFRGFGGGRSIAEGGGISRIRTSQMIHEG